LLYRRGKIRNTLEAVKTSLPSAKADIMPPRRANSVAANIRRIEAGEPIPDLSDKARGY
jgi:hypothetical protein